MISVIICSADATRAAAARQHFSALLGAEPFEVLLIENARSLAEGYNQGIAQSRGEVLIFAHDDIEILTADLVPRLRRHLEHFDVVGVAGTTRLGNGNWLSAGPPYVFGQVAHPLTGPLMIQQHTPSQSYLVAPPEPPRYGVWLFSSPVRTVGDIQALDGLFFACKRAVVEAVRFDEQRFDGFHLYDVDFTFAAYLAGFRIGVGNDLPILHDSTGGYDDRWRYYLTLFLGKYRGKLAPDRERGFQVAIVCVRTREEILEVMGCEREPLLQGER